MREGSPAWQRVQEEMRVFDGAPLAILFLLLIMRRPVQVQEFRRLLKRGHSTILDALRTLSERGYVWHVGGHGGWSLTSQAYQLPLLCQIASERQLEIRGGGGLLLDRGNTDSITTSTTPEMASERQLDTLSGDLSTGVVDKLLALGGLSVAGAKRAVERALLRGEPLPEIEAKIDRCRAYVYSSKGRGFTHAGAWAAPFVAEGNEPPHVEELPGALQGDPLSRFDGYLSEVSDAQDQRLDPEAPV